MNDHAQAVPTRAEALCRHCGAGPSIYPALAGPSLVCSTCWEGELDRSRQEQPPITVQFVRKGPSVCEYQLAPQEKLVGRLILYRDSVTLCVRFFSQLDGQSEVVLEEVLTRLGVARSQDPLDVPIMQAAQGGNHE